MPTRQLKKRTVRVFVSSTFADMQDEREELIKHVFPQLRRLCEARGVVWTSVDLRWGITDEEKAEGRVLSQCFAEIDRCRPYFIGILGERYGWIPETVDELPALCKVCGQNAAGRSVTELEILHGALNHRATGARVYLYFRQPPDATVLPGSAGTVAKAKQDTHLLCLKQRIRDSGLPLKEGYESPRQLGEWLLADLREAIEQDFPSAEAENPVDPDLSAHADFATGRDLFYVERPGLFDRLDAQVEGNNPPLVFTGEAGAGKTALLAAWAVRHQGPATTFLLVQHFVGATPASADWTNLVGRLLSAIDRATGIESNLPDSKEKLRLMFAEKLAGIGPTRRVVALIDGMDQLSDRDGARQLAWLPEVIPDSFRLIFAASDGETLEEVRRRRWQVQILDPLEPDEISAITKRFLGAYGKMLSPPLLTSIRSSAQTRNPLFLRVLLEELRVFGRHEAVREVLDRYLQCPSIETLLTAVLSRYEEDYECDRPGLVGDALASLWAAKIGLSEEELLDLLGLDGERLPAAYWVPLSLAAGFALQESAGLVTLSHRLFRSAVAQRYLTDEAAKRAQHRRLARYFQRFDLSPRQLEELPWQLAGARQWDELVAFLSDRRVFDVLWHQDPFSVQEFWIKIERHTAYRSAAAYQALLDDPKLSPATALACSHLLQNTGQATAALPFANFIVDRYRSSGEPAKLAMSLSHKGMLLIEVGDLAAAEEIMVEAQGLAEPLVADNPAETLILTTVLTGRAQISTTRSVFDDALHWQEQICALASAAHDQNLLAESLQQQALLHRLLGHAERSPPLLDAAEDIYRRAAGLEGLAAVLDERAKLCLVEGNSDGALRLLHEVAALYRQLNQPFWLAACCDEQARIHAQRGEYDRATALFAQAQAIYERHGNLSLLRWSLGNEAEVLSVRGERAAALKCLERAEALCRTMQAPDQLAQTLTREAEHRIEIGDLERAATQLKEAEELYRSAVPNDMLLCSNLLSQSMVFERRQQFEPALKVLRDAEPVCRRADNPQLLFLNLWAQNNLLAMSVPGGIPSEQLALKMQRLAREAGELAQQLHYDDVAASLLSQAEVLRTRFGR